MNPGLTVKIHCRLADFELNVDFHSPARGITVLFGPSGSGKTSVLRALAGLLRPEQGRIVLDDEVWQDDDNFLPTHRRPIGYVFQEASLFPHLNVRGNLEYGWRRINRSERSIGLEDAVSLLGIGHLMTRMPAHLSGGERQRVAIARALVTSPRLLLLDEPLSALDHQAKQAILPYLENLHETLAIPMLYVTHAADEVARLADDMVLLDSGKVQATGPAADILTRLDLPLARADNAASMLTGVVSSHDEHYHLTWIRTHAARFAVPREDLPIGHDARIRIQARDVSLALMAHHDTSILNIVPARVIGIRELGPTQAMVRLAMQDCQTLLARITRRSVETLGLREGMSLYAQIKSVALVG